MIKFLSCLLSLSIIFCSFTFPNGIHYRHINTEIPQSIHVLEVNPNKFKIVSVKALDACIGRENLLSIAKRKKAIGAINGGFFAVGGYYDGIPCGILKIDGRWHGLPIKPRGAIGWNNHEVLIDRVLTHLEDNHYYVDPQTDENQGQWERMDHIVGGTPMLIHRGIRILDFSSEQTIDSFLYERHARTAIGTLPNGNWVFVVVDGKQPDFSLGMTIEELAAFMENLGCIAALNLDGGGSSTLVFQNQVLNQPIGDGEDNNLSNLKPISDAILIQEKGPS